MHTPAALPSDKEFVRCVGKSLEVSEGFELLPHSDDVFEESSVLLLLHITQMASVSVCGELTVTLNENKTQSL